MSCLFCRIVAGEVPATKVYENDRVTAFRDVSPQAPLHVLIVPKEHIPTLNALEPRHDALIGEMTRVAVGLAADEGYAERGFRTVFNCNAEAGQSVYHVHLHVLAGRSLSWPPG